MAIAAGFGFTATGYVGCALALAGLGVWGVSAWLSRTTGDRVG
jgi:DHA1 family inner membrane transport protein